MRDAHEPQHQRDADASAVLAGSTVHQHRAVGVGDLVHEVDQQVGGILKQHAVERHERLDALVAGAKRIKHGQVDQAGLEVRERVPVPQLER